jgi:threonyl-tRNA synthetase
MRLLLWHVDRFASVPTSRGRSKVADDEPPSVTVDEAVVVFAQSERADEVEPEAVVGRATQAIADVAAGLKARTIVLHSFAHLFSELSSPDVARSLLGEIEWRLVERGHEVHQTAFGWFNELELHAKGHPYSRQARQV